MADMERLQTYKVVCEGGLNSNQNYLLMSDRFPGQATTLLNFEPSLYGGYRRLDGFEPLEEDYAEVDSAGSEGKILGIHIFEDDIIVARKTKSASTYKFFYWTSGADWTAYSTGLTHTVTNVDKIRAASYNFDGTSHITFVDGVNNAVIYDGTTWVEIDSADTGADMAHAGGNQALDAPKYITTFKNFIFVSGDPTYPQIVAYSAPAADYDWTTASGAGQINVGFDVVQIKPFRDELFVFGKTKIKKIVVSGTDFVIQDITNNGGCLASDSIVEVNGDLLFLAADGFRTIAGTERVGDIELGVVSKSIQQDVTSLISSADFSSINAVVVRRKSQVRFFFSNENLEPNKNTGIIGGLRGDQNEVAWEWGRLKGIRTSCCVGSYIGSEEYVLHGDYNGKVYRQESGNTFDGENILAIYTTPYLDFGDPLIRKTLHKVLVFLRAEGRLVLNTAVQYDWDGRDVFNPSIYLIEDDVTGTTYGTGVYGTSSYATASSPVLLSNIEGSGFSNRITFSTNDSQDSYSIQAIVYEFATNGRK